MRRRAHSARRVLANHPWATPLAAVTAEPRPATLRHHNAFIATLRAAGFSVELTAHAFALIDSYVFGFALSENALPIHGPDSVADTAASMMHFFDAEAYPPCSSSPWSTSCDPTTTSAKNSTTGST
jgi:hypothetical protein